HRAPAPRLPCGGRRNFEGSRGPGSLHRDVSWKGVCVSRRGWALFALMSVIWGVPYLLIKVADTGVSVPVLVFARVAVGAAVLLALPVWRRPIRALPPPSGGLALFA